MVVSVLCRHDGRVRNIKHAPTPVDKDRGLD